MKIFLVTERRADFSRFKPILKLIEKEKKINYHLVVTGLHLVRKHGYTINEILKEKFKVYKKFKMFDDGYFLKNDGAEMSNALGIAVCKLSNILNPILCLEFSYSFPIFPSPTIRYFINQKFSILNLY